MLNKTTFLFKNSLTSRFVFFGTLCVWFFWILSRVINVYQYALVGAIFEFLWLPMIVALFVLPIVSLWHLVKDKFSVKSLYLYSLLITTINFLILYLNK